MFYAFQEGDYNLLSSSAEEGFSQQMNQLDLYIRRKKHSLNHETLGMDLVLEGL